MWFFISYSIIMTASSTVLIYWPIDSSIHPSTRVIHLFRTPLFTYRSHRRLLITFSIQSIATHLSEFKTLVFALWRLKLYCFIYCILATQQLLLLTHMLVGWVCCWGGMSARGAISYWTENISIIEPRPTMARKNIARSCCAVVSDSFLMRMPPRSKPPAPKGTAMIATHNNNNINNII